ncbi:MAG: UDP-N-acetylmuramoyl-L-alanyl-D-glutamate--2,6-diaminopimelate ligase [Planctomycetes bacterium]|nr:UDP-N-acetylmuramoyl-L-alanyl-D-glutamate--2,6-diaminopimelate ligase [Planctomycetota bacterium]
MRKLGDLLHGLVDESQVGPHSEQRVSGVFDDSRLVQPGGIFVAVRGLVADGRRYIDDARRRGAVVLIGEGLPASDEAITLDVRDARRTLAQLASRWHDLETAQPDGLRLLAVTGTNGKSTTAFMAHAIARSAGLRCGMLGTVQYDLCARTVAAAMTTPGPLELAGYLRECIDAQASAAVMEVSSHALDQKRTDGLRFTAAALTNLTEDHLDYHGSFENYLAAKARLFQNLDESAVAVINRDDPLQAEVLRGCRARVVYYAVEHDADITARIARHTIAGTHYRMHVAGHELELTNALVGTHNVYNALAAVGLAQEALDVPPAAIADGLAAVRAVPGRLQRVSCASSACVFVDYAHTDDALRNVVGVLRPLTRRRLIVVFGCGGDRDRLKRPRMAQAVAAGAHAIIVTSDNPRGEDPRRIIDDILPGFDAAARRRVTVEPDRRGAIRIALAAAESGDVVLIAGKGHEDYQVVGARRLHFDDVEVVSQEAAELSEARSGAT